MLQTKITFAFYNNFNMDNIPRYAIKYDINLKAVICVWRGYSNSVEFRKSTVELLRLLVDKKASKMLVDLKEMTLIGKEDSDWIDASYIPAGIEQGLRAVAVVQPDSYFNKVAVESISFKLKKRPLQVNYFNTSDEAQEWLLKQI